MQGLNKDSKIQEVIEKVDLKTAIRYRVVEEVIDLEALRNEKVNLEEQLNMKEPTKEELIELGKVYHPYYQPKEEILTRISHLNKILGI